jgi:hypothetical protein
VKSRLLASFAALFCLSACASPTLAANSATTPSHIRVPTREERAVIYRELLLGWCLQRMGVPSTFPLKTDPLKDWVKVEGPGAIGIPMSPDARVEPSGRMVVDQVGGSCLLHGVDMDSTSLAMSLRRELLSTPFSARVKDEEIGPEGHFSEQRVDLPGGDSLTFVIMDPPADSAGAGMLTAQVVISHRPQHAVAAN